MEESLYIEVAKQIPSLAVLIWLVVHFLAHLKSRDQAHDANLTAAHNSCEQRIGEMLADARADNERFAKVVESATLMLGRVAASFRSDDR